MLNPTEHEISTTHKTKKRKKILVLQTQVLINVKRPKIVGILTFIRARAIIFNAQFILVAIYHGYHSSDKTHIRTWVRVC